MFFDVWLTCVHACFLRKSSMSYVKLALCLRDKTIGAGPFLSICAGFVICGFNFVGRLNCSQPLNRIYYVRATFGELMCMQK